MARTFREFALPLITEMCRRQHTLAVWRSLDREAPARSFRPRSSCRHHIVGDKQPNRVEPQRHDKRHKLVRPRRNLDPPSKRGSPGSRFRRAALKSVFTPVASPGCPGPGVSTNSADSTSSPSKGRKSPTSLPSAVVSSLSRRTSGSSSGNTIQSRPRTRTMSPVKNRPKMIPPAVPGLAAIAPNLFLIASVRLHLLIDYSSKQLSSWRGCQNE